MSRQDIFRHGSEKREQLIKEFYASPFEVGENVVIREKLINNTNDQTRTTSVKVVKVNNKTLVVAYNFGGLKSYTKEFNIKKEDVIVRNIRHIGVNPFNEKFDKIRSVNFDFESILFNLNVLDNKRSHRPDDEPYKINGVVVKDLNWNPYVYKKNGNKEYYQRDFCWTLQDKQLLIESIYSQIDCGKILIRKRGWSDLERMAANGETELAFNDLVDGKQRLNAVRGFIMGEYSDRNGNYYGDLSLDAQHKFLNHQLFSYAEMPEETSDEETIYQFLKLNFTGVPQSQEHLDFVKDILNKLS